MSDLIKRPEGNLSTDLSSEFGNIPQAPKALLCQVGQPTNQKNMDIGKFNFDSVVEWPTVDKLEHVVLLRPHMTRVLFGETFTSASRCGSDNSVTPSARYDSPISNECASCPMKEWDNRLDPDQLNLKKQVQTELKRKDLKSDKPDCAETINLLLMDKRCIPYILRAQKTQVRIVQHELLNKLRFKSKAGKRIFETAFDISLKKMQTPSGTWYEFQFLNFREVSPEDVPSFEEAWNTYADVSSIVGNINEKLDQEKEAAHVPF